MEFATTKISKNGQIVIPSEIRKEANIKPQTKFLVFQKNGTIILKQLRIDAIQEEMELLQAITRSEEQIKSGKFIEVDASTNPEEIDALLMKPDEV